jgi:ATP-binding cassette, subfamily B, bacterial
MDFSSGLAWPVGRLAEAIETLGRAAGLSLAIQAGSNPMSRRHAASADPLEGGIDRLSRRLEFEVESTDVTYADVDGVLKTAAPALLRVPGDDGDAFLALVSSSARTTKLLAPDGQQRRVPTAAVADWLRRPLEQPFDAKMDVLLADAKVPAARRPAARRALLGARLGPLTASRCWLLRPQPTASLWQHLRHARLHRRLAGFLIAYGGAALASIGSWWLIGSAALEGRFDPETLLAWSFLVLGLVPLALFAMWLQGTLVLGIGGILKLQLLAGALKLDPDETRHQGIGQHLGRVLESESVEALALSGGFYALAGGFDLVLAVLVLLAIGRGGQIALLLLAIGILWALGRMYYRRRQQWTATRLEMTHDLVEQMVGHRTRLVQESPVRRHEGEDQTLERYVELSKHMDRATQLLAAAPRIWLVAGLAGLAPQFVNADATPSALAVGLGATLLAYGAIIKITGSVSTLADALIGWKQVAPLLHALREPETLGAVDLTESIHGPRTSRSPALIAAQDLAFRFRDRADAVLRGCGFRIAAGDRIRLTGASGGGKSTLVSLLTGLRTPDSGLLLLDGLDRRTLGTRAWRRRVVAAPQFHENHLFNETLAFNLLMGRRWPPTADDVRWAEAVCRRIGLDTLLDRMPNGLFQVVGETGWQLSHGERSRVYMARALLQGADLVILDESFAELDASSLLQCLPEAAKLSKSLMVIAHA